MKKGSKNNRWFLFLLSSVALGVWGVIVFQFVVAVNHEPDSHGAVSQYQKEIYRENVPDGYGDSLFTSKLSVRNPFMLKRAPVTVKKSLPSPKPHIEKRLSIPINYIGFISNHEHNLALLDLGNGQTVIKKPGDRIAHIEISQISSSQVTVIENGHRFVLPILN